MAHKSDRQAKYDKAVEGIVQNIGWSMVVFERRTESLIEEGITIKGMTIRLPEEGQTDVLIIIRAETDTDALVGFHGGATLAEAVRGALERIYNRSIKWKEDQYA